MPSGALRSLATRYKVSVRTVESYWRHCRQAIKPKAGKDGYGIVMNCVKAKLRNRKKTKKPSK